MWWRVKGKGVVWNDGERGGNGGWSEGELTWAHHCLCPFTFVYGHLCLCVIVFVHAHLFSFAGGHIHLWEVAFICGWSLSFLSGLELLCLFLTIRVCSWVVMKLTRCGGGGLLVGGGGCFLWLFAV